MITKVWSWLSENAGGIAGALIGLFAFLELMASFTATEKDDKAVSVIKTYILKFLGLFTKKKEDVGDDKPDSK